MTKRLIRCVMIPRPIGTALRTLCSTIARCRLITTQQRIRKETCKIWQRLTSFISCQCLPYSTDQSIKLMSYRRVTAQLFSRQTFPKRALSLCTGGTIQVLIIQILHISFRSLSNLQLLILQKSKLDPNRKLTLINWLCHPNNKSSLIRSWVSQLQTKEVPVELISNFLTMKEW